MPKVKYIGKYDGIVIPEYSSGKLYVRDEPTVVDEGVAKKLLKRGDFEAVGSTESTTKKKAKAKTKGGDY